MPEDKPGPPNRKLALIAPVIIAVAIGAIILVAVLARMAGQKPGPAPAAALPSTAPPAAAPPPPAARAALTRRDLIEIANAASAAYPAMLPLEQSGKDALVGRRFAVSIPVGCEGPQISPGTSQVYYDYNVAKGSVRLVARPVVWTAFPLIQSLPNVSKIEAVEGFWIPRPWSGSDQCPQRWDAAVPATPTPPALPTLGLARFFETGASRAGRGSEHPYDVSFRVEDETRPLAGAFRLTLEGRLVSYPDGRGVRCWGESPDHRPICLVAVAFDRIAFEDPGKNRVLAEWRE